VHLSDEHIGFADLCPPDDNIDAPVSNIRWEPWPKCIPGVLVNLNPRPRRCDSRLVLLYPNVDYVLRNHWHPKLRVYGNKVVWFPLGHASGSPDPVPRRPIHHLCCPDLLNGSQVSAVLRRT
jgi:hypothetical protein